MATRRAAVKKGRGFQKRIALLLCNYFDLEFGEDLRVPVGCESGCDVKLLSRKAKDRIGAGIECKDKTKIGILAAIKQCVESKKKEYPKEHGEMSDWVIFKDGSMGRNKTYICLPLADFLRRVVEDGDKGYWEEEEDE